MPEDNIKTGRVRGSGKPPRHNLSSILCKKDEAHGWYKANLGPANITPVIPDCPKCVSETWKSQRAEQAQRAKMAGRAGKAGQVWDAKKG
ncbi:hypothetical protein QQS21_008213 [Conoideocrella luteorostrata]|uniref:Uncharacterized protein n=1 Tax=Conoideocrella luteorostrata TaxID=1105319 RepID=A0AAJ0CLY8_9HYPO|nr:hypothetical protein QQS21_008213 [Conoideocrella luteorostrata]